MNIVLLLAGGVGSRMGTEVPKQFLEVSGKPIIMHTLLRLEQASVIDKVVCVCIDGWIEKLHSWAEGAGIAKLAAIVPGGGTRYESTRRGMDSLEAADDDVIVVHDAVRPIVSDESLGSVVSVAAGYGNSMAVLDCLDTMYERTGNPGECAPGDGAPAVGGAESLGYTSQVLERERLVAGQTPEAVTGRRMREMYERADARGVQMDSISALQNALGWPIHFARGDRFNIKLTRPEDIAIFKAWLLLQNRE